jgi:hypothetical protein
MHFFCIYPVNPYMVAKNLTREIRFYFVIDKNTPKFNSN